MPMIEIVLRCMACGVFLSVAAGFLNTGLSMPSRFAGMVAALAAASFAVHSGGAETQALAPIAAPLWLMSAGGVGYFWLFARTLFSDTPLSWEDAGPPAALTVLAAIASLSSGPVQPALWILHNILEALLAAHAIMLVWTGWKDDLVQQRRELRAPFMVAAALLAVTLSGVEIAEYLGFTAGWTGSAQAMALLALGLSATQVFLEPRPALLEAPAAPAQRRPSIPANVRDAPILDKLSALMKDKEAWRREGLSIGDLAKDVGVPEHRLRSVINDGLGFRNFADYLSSFRIAAARSALSDPARVNVAISTIAFELGYASLGPFNRAFKDATGTTPTAYRAQALSASPNSENTR